MPLDLILRRARLTEHREPLLDIGIADGRIAEIAADITSDAPQEQLDGRLVIPGFVETHIHLDKSCILERCRNEKGTLEKAIAAVAKAKGAFGEAGIAPAARGTRD